MFTWFRFRCQFQNVPRDSQNYQKQTLTINEVDADGTTVTSLANAVEIPFDNGDGTKENPGTGAPKGSFDFWAKKGATINGLLQYADDADPANVISAGTFTQLVKDQTGGNVTDHFGGLNEVEQVDADERPVIGPDTPPTPDTPPVEQAKAPSGLKVDGSASGGFVATGTDKK